MKKRMVNESKLGYEYISDVISSCEQNGIQCIVDDPSAEILFYDPKRGKFSTSKQLNNADTDIFSLLGGEDKDQYDSIMSNCSGTAFTDFATRWNGLQKKEDGDDVFKTKKCEMIRMDLKESRRAELAPGMDDLVADWYRDAFPTDSEMADEMEVVGSTFYDVWRALNLGKDVYGVIGADDSIVRERVFQHLSELTGKKYRTLYNMWLRSANESNVDSDNPNDWSASEDEVEIQWMIDDEVLGIVSGSTESFVIDLDLVDCFEELVYQVTKAMEEEYGGMTFDYDDEWIFTDEDKWLKRFGYNMNESGSNGGTIDVTIKFTHGHYGKKLKSGDEKTIKLDTSTAPTIYDQDDMLTWIADVASDQIPGLGKVTKYDFETIDPPDDVLIRAVLGDEGFGPDVDVDFEDFEPEDVPSEISYKDALKFYRKMDDAYDERKLNYTKFDQIRNRLMDAVVKGLLKEKSLDELADEWFINYGTMNGWGWKTSFKYNVACALHKLHKAKHPDEHVVDREDTIRGWHSEKCSCGLASSSDSSD